MPLHPFRSLKRAVLTVLVRRQAATCGRDLRVNGLSKVNGATHLGDNVNFNGLTIVGHGEVRIGDNFHSGPECLLITDIHNYEGTALPYDATYIVRSIEIGDNVWLGSRVIILGGATIGEGAIIQAGSTVVGDIPACAIAGGHPARVFKHRDREHYDRLKAQGRFH